MASMGKKKPDRKMLGSIVTITVMKASCCVLAIVEANKPMPRLLQYVSAIVPLRYYLVIIRALLLKGVGVRALTEQIVALTIFAIAIMGAAAFRFRKRLD